MTTPTGLAPSQHDGLAVTAFIMAFIVSPLGLALGWVSVATAHRDRRHPSGLAVAAMALGLLFTVIGVVVIIAAVHSAAMAPASVPCDLTNPAYPYC